MLDDITVLCITLSNPTDKEKAKFVYTQDNEAESEKQVV